MVKKSNTPRRGRGNGRGKSESVTGKKAGEVEVSAQSTLNLPKPKDLKHHFMTIMGLKAKVDEASGRYREACARAKECGIDTGAITQTMKWRKKDPLDAKMHFGQLAALFKEDGMQVQLAIFDMKFESVEAEAAFKGRSDAEANRFAENTFPEGSAASEAYSTAYGNVQAERLGVGATRDGDAGQSLQH